MAWFLLTWNPDVWAGITDDDWDAFVDGADNGLAEGPWGTGARRSGIRPGDGILFLRQGRERGLLGTGEAISEVFEGQHFDDPTRVAHYVEFTFTEVRRIRDRIPTETLLESVPEVAWNALMGSGVRVPAAAIDRILQLWQGGTRHRAKGLIGVRPQSEVLAAWGLDPGVVHAGQPASLAAVVSRRRRPDMGAAESTVLDARRERPESPKEPNGTARFASPAHSDWIGGPSGPVAGAPVGWGVSRCHLNADNGRERTEVVR